jgi:hypothetical protein
MTKSEFRALFLRALKVAADNAEAKLAEPVPHEFAVALHGAGHTGQRINVDEAVSLIFLAENQFYRIIDLAVTEVLPGETVVFARISGHQPGDFAHTFDPTGLGPFKQVLAEHVADRRVHSG